MNGTPQLPKQEILNIANESELFKAFLKKTLAKNTTEETINTIVQRVEFIVKNSQEQHNKVSPRSFPSALKTLRKNPAANDNFIESYISFRKKAVQDEKKMEAKSQNSYKVTQLIDDYIGNTKDDIIEKGFMKILNHIDQLAPQIHGDIYDKLTKYKVEYRQIKKDLVAKYKEAPRINIEDIHNTLNQFFREGSKLVIEIRNKYTGFIRACKKKYPDAYTQEYYEKIVTKYAKMDTLEKFYDLHITIIKPLPKKNKK